jgi:hypothetical protein
LALDEFVDVMLVTVAKTVSDHNFWTQKWPPGWGG